MYPLNSNSNGYKIEAQPPTQQRRRRWRLAAHKQNAPSATPLTHTPTNVHSRNTHNATHHHKKTNSSTHFIKNKIEHLPPSHSLSLACSVWVSEGDGMHRSATTCVVYYTNTLESCQRKIINECQYENGIFKNKKNK